MITFPGKSLKGEIKLGTLFLFVFLLPAVAIELLFPLFLSSKAHFTLFATFTLSWAGLVLLLFWKRVPIQWSTARSPFQRGLIMLYVGIAAYWCAMNLYGVYLFFGDYESFNI